MVNIAEGQAAIHMYFYLTFFVHEFPCVKHAALLGQTLVDALVMHQILRLLWHLSPLQIQRCAYQYHVHRRTDLHCVHVFGNQIATTDACVHIAFAQIGIAVIRNHIDVYVWMLLQIVLYLRPKQAVYHKIIGNDAKRATGFVFGVDDLGKPTLNFFYRRAYQGDELLACLG